MLRCNIECKYVRCYQVLYMKISESWIGDYTDQSDDSNIELSISMNQVACGINFMTWYVMYGIPYQRRNRKTQPAAAGNGVDWDY